MENLYLIIETDNNVPRGIFTWEKMTHTFASPDWNKDEVNVNQWTVIDSLDRSFKVTQVMFNQEIQMGNK